MDTIRIVWGTATGATPTASYDAALAAANLHNFNLISVSSVIPAEANIELKGAAPELGEVGDHLTVVQSEVTVESGETGAAGIGWSRSESGRGIFYEETGRDEVSVRECIKEGLVTGQDLRQWDFCDDSGDIIVVEADSGSDSYVTAIVLAVYGRSQPILQSV